MRDFVRITIGVLAVFLFHTIFGRISPSVLLLLNVFSLVVVYFAMEKGEVFGSCFGAGCGLLQDYFTFGVYGVAGLAKTITGFLAGYISKKIDVHPPMRSFFFLFLLLSFDLVLWALLYSFIVPETIYTGGGLIYAQPLASALLGSIVFFVLAKLKKSKY